MYIKTLIASVIVSIVVSIVAYIIHLTDIFPLLLAYFSVALIAGCCASLWVNSAQREPAGSRPPKTRAAESSKETGSVKWFSPSKGFGFITRDNGEDIFVHFRSIMGKGHRVLREGERVEFAVTEGSKGLQAEEVNTLA